jgi:hypothetical protein
MYIIAETFKKYRMVWSTESGKMAAVLLSPAVPEEHP